MKVLTFRARAKVNEKPTYLPRVKTSQSRAGEAVSGQGVEPGTSAA